MILWSMILVSNWFSWCHFQDSVEKFFDFLSIQAIWQSRFQYIEILVEESCIKILCRLYKVKHCQNILEFLLLISKFQVYQMKNLVEEAICYYFSELAPSTQREFLQSKQRIHHVCSHSRNLLYSNNVVHLHFPSMILKIL